MVGNRRLEGVDPRGRDGREYALSVGAYALGDCGNFQNRSRRTGNYLELSRYRRMIWRINFISNIENIQQVGRILAVGFVGDTAPGTSQPAHPLATPSRPRTSATAWRLPRSSNGSSSPNGARRR